MHFHKRLYTRFLKGENFYYNNSIYREESQEGSKEAFPVRLIRIIQCWFRLLIQIESLNSPPKGCYSFHRVEALGIFYRGAALSTTRIRRQ